MISGPNGRVKERIVSGTTRSSGKAPFPCYGLAAVLMFIGVKMLLIDAYPIPVDLSLGVVVLIIGSSVFLSLQKSAKKTPAELPG